MDGETIPLSRVTVDHAYAVGATLGRLHECDVADPRLPGPNTRTLSPQEWQDLAKRSEGQPWSKQLSNALALLASLSAGSAVAAEALRREPTLVSHRDLVPENVLWNAKAAWLIDWESAAWTNPMAELVAAAIDWSGYIEGRSDQAIFDAVIEGYRAVAPFDPPRAARAPRERGKLAPLARLQRHARAGRDGVRRRGSGRRCGADVPMSRGCREDPHSPAALARVDRRQDVRAAFRQARDQNQAIPDRRGRRSQRALLELEVALDDRDAPPALRCPYREKLPQGKRPRIEE